MKNDKIIIIKGRKYDSATGLPIPGLTNAPKINSPKVKPNSTALHSLAQKSQTLYRKATQKPINQSKLIAHKVGKTMDIAKSKSISHFNSLQASVNPRQKVVKPKMDIGPSKHPIMNKIEKKREDIKASQKRLDISKPAKVIKEEAIAEAVKKMPNKSESKKSHKKHHKFLKISTLSIVAIVIIGFLVYFYMPSFSVRIASAQAGINASYPEYCPDGYSLSGPVFYNNGEVIINFHANSGKTKFSIIQTKSSWDSSAVKAKAEKDSGGEFSTTSEKGLTIFNYDNNAIWVNGGILYSITGDAPLSGDQIRRIATSL